MNRPANLFVVSVALYCVVAVGTSRVAYAETGVRITEIMYDTAGADAGHEWVEITNTGDTLDPTTLKLFEADSNHTIKYISRGTTLASGMSAIIADDPAVFKSDWPSYSGPLFDSAFSLSNAGETIALKDASSSVLDTVSYDTSLGAAGDGSSLHRSGGGWYAGSPDLGIFTGSASLGTPTNTDTASETSDAASSGSTSAQVVAVSVPMVGTVPTITLGVEADAVLYAGAGSEFSAKAFGTQGAPIADARFSWNFGDGATGEGQTVLHTYAYPGKYAVTVTGASGFSSAMSRVVVDVVSVDVRLVAEQDGSLSMVNRTDRDLLVGGWSIVSGDVAFVIPRDTILLARGGIRFSSSVLGFHGSTQSRLMYPNGIAVGETALASNALSRGETLSPTQASGLVGASSAPARTKVADGSRSAATDAKAGGEVKGTQTADMAGSFWWFWLIGAGALALVAAAGLHVAEHGFSSGRVVTSVDPEEFDIP